MVGALLGLVARPNGREESAVKRRLKTPSPSLAISLVALFVALGGTAYAVT